MCITEIWKYGECGCSHERQLLCAFASNHTHNPKPSVLPTFRSVDFMTISNLGYTPVAQYNKYQINVLTGSSKETISQCDGGRSINKIVHKQFLLSICEGCLLKEVKLHRNYISVSSSSDQNNQNNQNYQNNANTDTNHYELFPDTDRATVNENLIPKSQQERSIKVYRRRGFDLNRENIRTISRWNDGTQQTVMNVYDVLKEAKTNNMMAVLAELAKKKVSMSCKRSREVRSFMANLSTSLNYMLHEDIPNCSEDRTNSTAEELGLDAALGKECSSSIPRNHILYDQYYTNSMKSSMELQHSQIRSDNMKNNNHDADSKLIDSLYDPSIDNTINAPLLTSTMTWEEHLEHDVTQGLNRRKAPTLGNAYKSIVVVHEVVPTPAVIHNFHEDDVSENWTPTKDISLPYRSLTEHQQSYTGERLGDVISSDEFESDGEGADQWRNIDTGDMQ